MKKNKKKKIILTPQIDEREDNIIIDYLKRKKYRDDKAKTLRSLQEADSEWRKELSEIRECKEQYKFIVSELGDLKDNLAELRKQISKE